VEGMKMRKVDHGRKLMSDHTVENRELDVEVLREAIQEEYA
jgi:hypothetical protein